MATQRLGHRRFPRLSKKLFIKTWGCQMNAYDSARMADVLAPHGYQSVDAPEGADVVILNTCHIREKAAEKVFSELGRLRALQRRRAASGGRMVLAVAGCVAQAEGAEMVARAPYLDLVFGPQTYHRLPEMIAEAAARSRPARVETDFPVESKFDRLPEETLGQGTTAFLAVQEGCDKFCTFCVVPYTRGAEYSRPAAQILAEARRLVEAGACELTLLGQNVNAYHGEGPDGSGWGLARLLATVAEIPGVARLRYTTSHPLDLDDDLIAAHRDLGALMPFLHLPVQSGSDRILAAMNRRHRADDYRRVVERLRAARPDMALSSDFIVGFPGEEEADFLDTLHLAQEIGFAQAYSFKYSPRPGTPAAEAGDQVAEPVKAERLARLQERLNADQSAYNQGCVGRTMMVLFDRPGRKAGQWLGRSPYMQAVHVAAEQPLLGRLAAVQVTAGLANSLAGVLAAGGLVAGILAAGGLVEGAA